MKQCTPSVPLGLVTPTVNNRQPLLQAACEWIQAVVQEQLAAADLHSSLRDGVFLCKSV